MRSVRMGNEGYHLVAICYQLIIKALAGAVYTILVQTPLQLASWIEKPTSFLDTTSLNFRCCYLHKRQQYVCVNKSISPLAYITGQGLLESMFCFKVTGENSHKLLVKSSVQSTILNLITNSL